MTCGAGRVGIKGQEGSCLAARHCNFEGGQGIVDLSQRTCECEDLDSVSTSAARGSSLGCTGERGGESGRSNRRDLDSQGLIRVVVVELEAC